MIKDLLEYHGYQVLEAGNGVEGTAMAKEHRPDLILMDIQMPVMDGMSAAKIIKNDPETRGITMIALTSFAMKGDKERFFGGGVLRLYRKADRHTEAARDGEKIYGERSITMLHLFKTDIFTRTLKLNCKLHIANCKVQNDLNHIMAGGPYCKFSIYTLYFALAAGESREL